MGKLRLPERSRHAVRQINRFGRGQRLAFQRDGSGGEMLLTRAHGAADTRWCRFRCAGGLFALQTPNPLLQLLADCPTLHQPDAPLPDWYWRLLNQQLPEALQACWGELAAGDGDLQDPQLFNCRVTLGDARQQSLLALSAATLQYWLDNAAWQPQRRPLSAELPLTLPVRIAELTLSPRRLATLRPGDVLLPASRFFLPDGSGRLLAGAMWLEGQLCNETTPATFTLSAIKESDMVHSYPLPDGDETTVPASGEPHQEYELQDLPLEMSVRCGTLRLTLGELQQLAPGSTLTVDHVIPGDALLCHGNFQVAKGELVDVEGHLGFQVVTILNANPVLAQEG